MKFQIYLKHLKELSASKPQYADIQNNLGMLLSFLGKHSEALEPKKQGGT